MPTIEENKKYWNDNKNWPSFGEGWSLKWGGSDLEWWGTIYPRIHLWVPTSTILEIAPGYGRWTKYLKELCNKLFVVDLSETCIEACKRKFSDSTKIEYYVNDGKSLKMIPDRKIDFAFSFDSLVHADEVAMKSYVNQLRLKLKKDGVAFIHHSNIGKYIHSPWRIIWDHYWKLPQTITSKAGFASDHWRGRTMTAQKMVEYSENAGMKVISQECINFGSPKLIDCISILTPKDSIWRRNNTILNNSKFMKEILNLKRIARLYGEYSFSS